MFMKKISAGRRRVFVSLMMFLPFLVVSSCQKESGGNLPKKDNAADTAQGGQGTASGVAEQEKANRVWVAKLNGAPITADLIHDEFVGDSRLIHQLLANPTERVLKIAVEKHIWDAIFAEEARKRGLSPAAQPEIEIERDLVERVYYLRDLSRKIAVTDEEIKDKTPSVFSRIRISSIVFGTHEEADSARGDLVSGRKRWEDLDERFSKESGGSWTWPYPNSGFLDKRQSDEIFTLKKGDVTSVYKLGIGYTIFRLEDREDLSGPQIARLKDALRGEVRQAKMRMIFDEWRKAHRVSRMDTERKEEFFRLIESFERGGRKGATVVATMDGAWKLDLNTLYRVARKFPTYKERMEIQERTAFLGTVLDAVINARIISRGAREAGYVLPREVDAELKNRETGILSGVLVENVVANLPAVTDAQVLEYYEKNRQEYRNRKNVKASHILVKTSGEAEEVYGKVARGGMSFKEAEKKYSVDETAGIGGDLGWIVPGKLIKELDSVIFSLKVGEISRPVASRFGFHIIMVSDSKVDKDLSLRQVRPEIVAILEKKMEADAKTNFAANIRKDYKIEYNKENLEILIRRLEGEKDDLFLNIVKKSKGPHGAMEQKKGMTSPHGH